MQYTWIKKDSKMPQLSLYLDAETLKKVESAAKREKISISQWVRNRVQISLDKNWPENYFNLFGSIKDETFTEVKELPFSQNSIREEF